MWQKIHKKLIKIVRRHHIIFKVNRNQENKKNKLRMLRYKQKN